MLVITKLIALVSEVLKLSCDLLEYSNNNVEVIHADSGLISSA